MAKGIHVAQDNVCSVSYVTSIHFIYKS